MQNEKTTEKKKKKSTVYAIRSPHILSGFYFLSILTITVINGAFLEKYYVTKKIDVLLDLRTTLENTDIDKMMNSDSSEGTESIPDESREPAPETIFPGLSLTAAIPAGFPGCENEKMLQASCSDMSMIWMRMEIRAGH